MMISEVSDGKIEVRARAQVRGGQIGGWAGHDGSAGRATIDVMVDCLTLQCPYCGQPVELYIDMGGGPRQDYVEDCPVCCRPWQVDAWIGDDGSWCAILRTADE